MRLRAMKTWVSALAALSLILWASLASAELPKNVILMISDGMGYNTMKATDYWTGTTAVYENFPVKYGVSTFSANNTSIPAYNPTQAWTNFDYVKSGATDSASAATAMATGVKNYDGQINWSTAGLPLTNMVQIAGGLGKATGVVTTVEWSHATPAGMVAHNASRNNYSQLANEMIYNSNLNVIMGAGNPDYNNNGQLQSTPLNAQYVGGTATWNALKDGSAGWSLIQSKTDFESLANGTLVLANPNKVVGTVEAYTTTQQARSGTATADPGVVPLNSNVPSLATMTSGALNLLKNNTEKTDGFFLMVEGGAVDWANHANQKGRMIEEQMDFNASVEAAMAWVNANSNWDDTLLIVTADHETGHLWGPAAGAFNEVVDNNPGLLPGMAFNSGDHTNSLIPLFAIGAYSDLFSGYADQFDPVRGLYVDNTEIFQVMNGNPVPVPAAIWLLGSGLAGLGLLRRRSPLP